METTQTHVPDQEPQENSRENSAADPAILAQTSEPSAPPDDSERAAAAGGGASSGRGPGEESVLQEFLRDGPPEVEEEAGQQESEQRPVDLQQRETPTPDQAPPQDRAEETSPPSGDEPPRETAAQAPLTGGGTSLYDDDFGGPPGTASASGVAVNLVGDPLFPDSEDPLVVEQFGDPIILSSSTFALAGTQDVTTSNFDAPPPQPVNEPDPLTEREIAAGGDNGNGGGGGGPTGSVIMGTSGDDLLTGTAGDDTFVGGDGADTFSFSLMADEGSDVISDFGDADILQITDVVDADNSGSVDLGDLDAAPGNTATGTSDSLVLGLSSGTTVTLAGVDGTGVTSFTDLDGKINVDVG